MTLDERVYVRPWLADYQRAALFCPERYAVLEATVKSGKTVGAMAWLCEQAVLGGRPGRYYWWVAPIFAQTRIAYGRTKRGLPPGQFVANETALSIHLPNGAALVFKSGEDPDSLYGEDVWAAVVDEASRVREESWHAVRSTLTATRGPVRLVGNVKGRRNWFYRLARAAEAGEPGMHHARITAHDAVAAGLLAADEIADAQRLLPEAVFRELYLAEPSDDEGNPFGLAAIRARVAPLSRAPPVAWGVDLAKSTDWTVCVGLDAAHRVCRLERFQRSWRDTIRVVRDLVGDAPALVDSTGVGDPVLEALQAARRNYEGFKFTAPSKQQLMEGLAVAIQRGTVSYPDGVIVHELEAFEYQYTRTGVQYCMSPETPVLTYDLRWVPVGDLHVGDGLLAFDECPPIGAKSRRWTSADVTAVDRIIRSSYRIVLDDGTEFTASAEHQWLVPLKVPGEAGKLHWRRTDRLRGRHPTSRSPRDAASQLVRLVHPWPEASSYEAGYLAAAFDGEGNVSQLSKHGGRGHNARVGFAQHENEMAAQVRTYLRALGFSWAEHRKVGRVHNFGLLGGRAEVLRFLGQVRPRRLLERFDPDKLGTLTAKAFVGVRAVEPIGDQLVVALATTTGTFVADGFASHNSAPEGVHDDAVCALALAVMKAGHPRRGWGAA